MAATIAKDLPNITILLLKTAPNAIASAIWPTVPCVQLISSTAKQILALDAQILALKYCALGVLTMPSYKIANVCLAPTSPNRLIAINAWAFFIGRVSV
jgi:hypothetical protein